ncbi:MAG TPA: hypothetical protein VIT64_13125, partial [Ilumatobacteraceae bacterium]
CKLRDEVPQFAEAGRARVEGQIRLARVIGQLAVKQGRREVVRRLDGVAEQRRGASAPLVVEALLREEPAVEQAVVERPAVKKAPVKKAAVKKAAVKKAAVEKAAVEKPAGRATPATVPAAAPIDAASLPISDYDSLAASQVVARLEALGPDDLTAIGSYEAATRGRRTILGKVHQLQAG